MRSQQMADPSLPETSILEKLIELDVCETSTINLQRVDEGSENTCWIINEDLVIRINFDYDSAYETFAREARVKNIVALETNKLSNLNKNDVDDDPQSQPGFVPTSIKTGRLLVSDKQAAYTIDRRLRGQSLEETSLTPQAEAALANLLLALKAPDTVSQAQSAGVPHHPPIDLNGLLEQATQALERLTRNSQIPRIYTDANLLGLDSCQSFVTAAAAIFVSERLPLLQTPSETIEPSETAEPIQPKQPIQFTESIQTAEASQTTKPIQTTQPIQTAEPIQPIHPIQTTQPIQTTTQPTTSTPSPSPTNPTTSPPALLHADLKGEHIILHPTSHRLAGVLDWCDATIGPGCIDIEGLAISVGAAAAVRIAASAGYGVKDCAWGVYLARCETVLRLDEKLNGVDDGSPVGLLGRQLGRAFEGV